MTIEKRVVVAQTAVFTFLFFYGLSHIIKELIGENKLYDTLVLIFSGLIIVGGLTWYFATKKDDYITQSKTFLTQTKWIFYIVAVAFILQLFSLFIAGYPNIQKYMVVFSGAILSVTSLFGTYISIVALVSRE